MYLKHTLVTDEDVQTFWRYLAPLNNKALARVSIAERRALLDAAVDQLGVLNPTWSLDGLLAEGKVVSELVVGSSVAHNAVAFVHRRSRGTSCQQCGLFTVHQWLLRAATGCPYLVPAWAGPARASADARVVEFTGGHFHMFSNLSAAETKAIALVRPWSELREPARSAGDAPQWSPERVAGHVDSCISQCEQVLRLVQSGQRDGLAVIIELNNDDWDYD